MFVEIGNNMSIEEVVFEEYWEIRMGFLELRNGKWVFKVIISEVIFG